VLAFAHALINPRGNGPCRSRGNSWWALPVSEGRRSVGHHRSRSSRDRRERGPTTEGA
jgi:hypothetical protein